jgi:hypothetical protein
MPLQQRIEILQDIRAHDAQFEQLAATDVSSPIALGAAAAAASPAAADGGSNNIGGGSSASTTNKEDEDDAAGSNPPPPSTGGSSSTSTSMVADQAPDGSTTTVDEAAANINDNDRDADADAVALAFRASAEATNSLTMSLAGLRALAVMQLAGGGVLLAERVVASLGSSKSFADSKVAVPMMGIAMLCMVSLFAISSTGLEVGAATHWLAPKMADFVMILGMVAAVVAIVTTVKGGVAVTRMTDLEQDILEEDRSGLVDNDGGYHSNNSGYAQHTSGRN